MTNKHIGSDFDDFLREDGILDDAEAVATKRVIAFQIAQAMKSAQISQSELARRMNTSRSAVERLLDLPILGHASDARACSERGGQAAQGPTHGVGSVIEQTNRHVSASLN